MRKQFKSLLCLALAALLSLSLLPTPAFAEEAGSVDEAVVEHVWGEWTVTREPTCTEPGEQTRSCTDEGCDATDTQAIPVRDHTWGEWTVTREPTCTEPGEKVRSCTVEGCDAVDTQTIPAGHTWGDWTITREPTFEETGEREHTCSVCELTEKEEIAKLDTCKTLTYQFGTGGDALTVVVEGKFSQKDAALDLRGLNADEIEPLQTMLEEELERKTSGFRGVRLVDEKNVITMLTQKDMSFSVGGSWLPENAALTFAILDEYGKIRIVEAEKDVPDDDEGAVTYTFTADVLNALLWAVAEAPASEPADVKTIDPGPVRVQATTPTLREGEGDSIHTYTGKIVLPFTKNWDDNNNALGLRPDSITVYLYRFTGETYSPSDDPFMTATVTAEENWKHDFEIIDTNTQHDAFNGDTPYNFAFAEGPITYYEEDATKHDDPEVILTFGGSTNDDWTRITPNNTRDWDVETNHYPMNFVVIKEAKPQESEDGHTTKFVVWTPDALSDYEKTLLLAYIKTHNSWNSETYANTEWVTGLGSYGGITVTSGSPSHLHFDATSNWAYFAVGSYTRSTTEQYAGSITNKLETTSITVTKIWSDDGNRDGQRPTAEDFKDKVKLLANGTDVTSTYSDKLTVTDNGDNTYTITYTGLPKNGASAAITYTIDEDTIQGYTPSNTQPVAAGGSITNTHTPETTSITVTKIWSDDGNRDGQRPTAEDFKAKVKLLANGTDVTSTYSDKLAVTDNGDDTYTITYTGLLKNENGSAITYTIDEDTIQGYTPSNTQPVAAGGSITNTHTPETTSITVTKIWSDDGNRDGQRPTAEDFKAKVKLLANGTDVTSTYSDKLTVTDNGDDTYTITYTGLPKNENGSAITYTIDEDTIQGYTPSNTQPVAAGGSITNTHTPETTSITVTKIWSDDGNRDGQRPTAEDFKDKVKLLANGTDVTSTYSDKLTVTDNGDDTYTITYTGLLKNENGSAITYTIDEDTIQGYTPSNTQPVAAGGSITNTHTPETTSITVTKIWSDDGNRDGQRPTAEDFKAKVKLLANGTDVTSTYSDKLTVTDNGDDTYTITYTGLPKNENGSAITYTIDEDTIQGYTPSNAQPVAAGGSITNTHTPETTSITVTKIWSDDGNRDGQRPTAADFKAKVKLLANGTDVTSTYSDKLTVTDNGDDTYTITYTGLLKNENGSAITYTIDEASIDGYTASGNPAADGGTITNAHTPEKITITGKKTWDDKNNQDGQRPTSITITLLANGKTQSVLIVTEKDGWAWTFSGMPKYENGKEIKYTITENPVKGYVSTVKGYNVTNTRTYEQLLPTGQLTWPIPVLGGLGLLLAGYGLLLLLRRRRNGKA